MLPRHKKAFSDMKSAEKKLKDARTKYIKTKEVLAKSQQGVASARPASLLHRNSRSLEESGTNRECCAEFLFTRSWLVFYKLCTAQKGKRPHYALKTNTRQQVSTRHG